MPQFAITDPTAGVRAALASQTASANSGFGGLSPIQLFSLVRQIRSDRERKQKEEEQNRLIANDPGLANLGIHNAAQLKEFRARNDALNSQIALDAARQNIERTAEAIAQNKQSIEDANATIAKNPFLVSLGIDNVDKLRAAREAFGFMQAASSADAARRAAEDKAQNDSQKTAALRVRATENKRIFEQLINQFGVRAAVGTPLGNMIRDAITAFPQEAIDNLGSAGLTAIIAAQDRVTQEIFRVNSLTLPNQISVMNTPAVVEAKIRLDSAEKERTRLLRLRDGLAKDVLDGRGLGTITKKKLDELNTSLNAANAKVEQARNEFFLTLQLTTGMPGENETLRSGLPPGVGGGTAPPPDLGAVIQNREGQQQTAPDVGGGIAQSDAGGDQQTEEDDSVTITIPGTSKEVDASTGRHILGTFVKGTKTVRNPRTNITIPGKIVDEQIGTLNDARLFILASPGGRFDNPEVRKLTKGLTKEQKLDLAQELFDKISIRQSK